LTEEDNQRWRSRYKEILGDKVKFLNRLKSQSDLVYWMNVADFGFFPARAEGWNMELHEMLWLQKPCVTTNYSAHTAYVNKHNSILINIDGDEPCFDGHFFYGQGSWAKLGKKQKGEMVDGLRSLYYSKRGNQRKLAFNFKSIGTLTWEESAKKIIEGLR
jgi:glycosyltransferase involved in cell wall biosynthesis